MARDFAWRLTFAVAIAALMLMILLIRSQSTPLWVVIVYPAVGALLAYVASRTSPRTDEISWIEASTIAAACIVLLAVLINLLVIEQLLTLIAAGGAANAPFQKYGVVILQGIAVVLWLALSRRLERMRRRRTDVDEGSEEAAGPDGESA